MTRLHPFADDAVSITLGDMTIENGTARIALYGSLDITRDQQGLARARALLTLLSDAVKLLQNEPDLPATAAKPAPPKSVPNPFD